MRAQLAACVVVGLLLAGCGAGDEKGNPANVPPDVRVVSTSEVTTELEGGTPAQRELLREILAGLGTERIERVAIRDADREFAPFDEGDVVLAVEIQSSDGYDSRADWETWLLAGAFDYRSHVLGLPGVVWLEVQGGGNRLEGPEDLDRLPHLVHPGGGIDAVIERVTNAADASGSELARLEILQPYGLAPAVTLRVADPADFLHDRLRGFLEVLDDRWERWEGTRIEVVDDHGIVVWRTAGSSRLSMGSGWTAPDLEGCWAHGLGTLGYTPPPCPVRD